jgi:hypothetical protein
MLSRTARMAFGVCVLCECDAKRAISLEKRVGPKAEWNPAFGLLLMGFPEEYILTNRKKYHLQPFRFFLSYI